MPFIKCLLWTINLLTTLYGRLAGPHFMTQRGENFPRAVQPASSGVLRPSLSTGPRLCWQGILNARPRWGAIICSVNFSEVSVNNSSASEVSKILKQSWFQTLSKEESPFSVGGRLPSTLPSFSPLPRGGNCHQLFKSPTLTWLNPR